ncbi:MAG: hypothetical protein ACLP4W_03595 [Mycobacterium sp.]|uniref:hypothetical protein n=1 Tax=Mycobacterium sp. TaxID=1785 RepID=UPI003F9D974E
MTHSDVCAALGLTDVAGQHSGRQPARTAAGRATHRRRLTEHPFGVTPRCAASVPRLATTLHIQ